MTILNEKIEEEASPYWLNGQLCKGAITTFWYKEGLLHREEGPAIEYANGIKEWYFEGKLHRENAPAREYPNGDSEWYQLGLRHRLDGPAIDKKINKKEFKVWYFAGLIHRMNEVNPTLAHPDPSYISPLFNQWFYYGKLHREDGPAIVFHQELFLEEKNLEQWYIDDKEFSEEVFNKLMENKKLYDKFKDQFPEKTSSPRSKI